MIKKEFKKPLMLIAFALLGFYIVNNLEVVVNVFKSFINIMFPFILGAFIAFILNIPMEFFSKKMRKMKNKKLLRALSLIFSLIVVLLIVLLVITLIVPELVNVLNLLIDNIPYYTEKLNDIINNLGIDIFNLSSLNIDTEVIKGQLINQIPNFLTYSISIISNIARSLSNFFIAIIFAIYILIDKEKLQSQVKKLLDAYFTKKKADKVMYVCATSNTIFKKFFTVQCLEATILGSLCILGMLILRLPHAVPIGILVGVTALIPVMGAFIGVGIGAILIVCINPVKALIFIIFVLILQQIEGNIIYPKVVGKSVGLPGIWVLAAVILGGSLGGVIGMLLGVPIATTIYYLIRNNANNRIKAKNAN